MRYNNSAKQLLADGVQLIKESWTDGSYLMMNSGGVVYKVTRRKNGKEVTKIFNPALEDYKAEDYNFRRVIDRK